MLTEPPIRSSSSSSSSPTNDETASNPPASWYDYMREGWKDLELEMRLRSHDVQRGWHVTKGTVRHAYKGTGRAVKHTLRSVRNELSEELQELQADWTVQRRLVQEDWHDLIDASRGWRSHVHRRHSQQAQQQQQQQQAREHRQTQEEGPNHSNPASQNSDVDERQLQAVMHNIRDFEAKLADPLFAAELNTLIQSKLTSCSELVEYYQQRPELREFTLNKELSRMRYVLFTEKGQKLTEPEEILNYAMAHPDQQHDILWRAANQSIFGDVITSLTCEMGLVRPQLSTASFVDDVSVTIDLGRDAPHITAECFVNVSIPGWEGERLQLAGVLVGVYFCPVASKMEARVLLISASPPLTEPQLQGAAINLSQQ